MARAKAPRLDRGELVARALRIVDGEGLEGLTTRRLAADAGVTPMALYWHFRDKVALLDAVAEAVLSGVDATAARGSSWVDGLGALLTSVSAALRPHPFLSEVVARRITASEAGLEITEATLSLLSEAGLANEAAAETATYLLHAIIALIAATPGASGATADFDQAAVIRERRARLGALDPSRFPNVVASAAALAVCSNEEAYVARGIRILVEGVRELSASGRPAS